MAIDEYPSISETILGWTPFVKGSVAQVCLRSWNCLSTVSHLVWGRVVPDIPDICRELVAVIAEEQRNGTHTGPVPDLQVL
jgi:hypothetical protein